MTTQEALRKCNSLHCGPQRHTAVYRLYDRNQRLLYVGIAHDTKRRWRQHAREKAWWDQVHWRTEIWHTSRLGAAIEEYCAIRFENPVHNKNREYDYRLGSEPTAAPGRHQPRPWRLDLLASAMTLPDGGISWSNAAPHYAAAKRANQNGVKEGRVRIWFPQVPELGCWQFDGASLAEIHKSAAIILTQHYGLEPASFTLSIHDADGCAEPPLDPWVDPEEELETLDVVPARPRWQSRLVPKLAVAFVEWWGNATMGMFAGIGLDMYVEDSHRYSPTGVVLMGMAGGLLVRAASKWIAWKDGQYARKG